MTTTIVPCSTNIGICMVLVLRNKYLKMPKKQVLAKGFGKSKNSQLTTKVNVYLNVPKFKLSSLTYESTLFVNSNSHINGFIISDKAIL
jgi:hypothetical protein